MRAVKRKRNEFSPSSNLSEQNVLFFWRYKLKIGILWIQITPKQKDDINQLTIWWRRDLLVNRNRAASTSPPSNYCNSIEFHFLSRHTCSSYKSAALSYHVCNFILATVFIFILYTYINICNPWTFNKGLNTFLPHPHQGFPWWVPRLNDSKTLEDSAEANLGASDRFGRKRCFCCLWGEW